MMRISILRLRRDRDLRKVMCRHGTGQSKVDSRKADLI